MNNHFIVPLIIFIVFFTPGCNKVDQTPTTGLTVEPTRATGIQRTETPIATSSSTASKTPATQTPKPTKITPTKVIPQPTLGPSATTTEVSGTIILDPNKQCRKVPRPEFAIHPQPGVLYTGTFYLCIYWPSFSDALPNSQPLSVFDLDTGRIQTVNDYYGDFEYFVNPDEGSDPLGYIIPSGAKFYQTSADMPTYEDCYSLINSGIDDNPLLPAKGAKVCVYTNNDGCTAFVQVKAINEYGKGSLTAFFITWDK